MRSLVLFFIFTSSLFAEEAIYECSTEEINAAYPRNTFLTATDHRIACKVDPITGHYCEAECDLIVAGGEPLSLRRFYHSNAPYDRFTADWRYNPESFCVANLEWDKEKKFVSVGEQEGIVNPFFAIEPNLFHFEQQSHFLSFTRGGDSHPANIVIHFERINECKRHFQYSGVITDGSGRTRNFLSPLHCWLDRHTFVERCRFLGIKIKKKWNFYPETWTPYQLPIIEEKLPNGNLICYEYVNGKKEREGFPYPRLLSRITAYNASKSKMLGSLQFIYIKDLQENVTGIQVIGSDGRTVHLYNTSISPYKLLHVKASGKPKLTYDYCKEEEIAHMPRETGTGRLEAISKPQGTLLRTEYDEEGRVKIQYAPVGPKGQMHPIGSYEYSKYKTEMVDAEGNKTIYHFDKEKRLHAIYTLREGRTYQSLHLTWDPYSRNLMRHVIKDDSDQIVRCTEYKYDCRHNPIEEKVGKGDEWRIIRRTYSDDGYNLKLSESDRPERVVRYRYFPGTNLLLSELTFEKEKIRKRIFHFYDDCAICVKTIIDDGCTEDPNSLEGVTYRKSRHVTPKATHPCFGLPEVIEEKTIDESGCEILLNKIVYKYAPSGKILEETHYNAEGKWHYSLSFQYDEQERVIARTDPLGGVISYSYDANNNLLSIKGPREKQYCEISYDSANRPIRMTSWQHDGTKLVSEKYYDKLGRVIRECDPAGNVVAKEYDLLGYLVATYYPDGAIERKEVDLFGNVVKESSGEGEETFTEYNVFQQPLAIYYPDGSEEHFTYNTAGTLNSHLDKNGAITFFTYDIFDHLIKSESYSSSGQLLKSSSAKWTAFNKIEEQEGDLIIYYHYDFAGRKIREEKGNQIILYSNDSEGRIATIQQGNVIEERKYDKGDHLIRREMWYQGILQKEESYSYDLSGNCIGVHTFRGVTKSIFDCENRPLLITDPEGYETRYSYSPNSTLITSPQGVTTMICYDGRGREKMRSKRNHHQELLQQSETFYNKNGDPTSLVHIIFSGKNSTRRVTHRWEYGPMHRIERFIEAGEKERHSRYDKKGRLECIIEANGSEFFHRYDDLGRVVRYFSNDFDYQYCYDQRGRILSVSNQSTHQTTTRCYDSLSHITHETLENGVVISYRYDELGRRAEVRLFDGSSIFYNYEGLFLQSISREGWTHHYMKRNLEGEVEEAKTMAGNIITTRDCKGQISSIRAPTFTASGYHYDSEGNLLSYHYEDAKGAWYSEYSYDDLDHLIQEDEMRYQCDSIHNRLKKDSYEYAVNILSEVLHDGEKAYCYDYAGNVTQEGKRRYYYDSLHRMIAVEEEGQKVEYKYDSFHRRLSKMVYPKKTDSYQVFYLWDGNEEIGSINERGELLELRILGEGLGAEIGGAVCVEVEGKRYVPIHDHQGSLVSLVDPDTGQSAATYRYNAFGEEKISSMLSPWRFSSKRKDEETGLIFFGRRYYHAALGRWMTQDPKGFKDGPNLYAYLHHSPLTQVDLYGLEGRWSDYSKRAFEALEWVGANVFFPSPARTVIESIGRCGAGGDLFGESRYRTYRNEVIAIPGKNIEGYSLTHGNGMLTTRSQAIEQAEYISKVYGDIQIDLLYQGTQGMMMDLLNCIASKCGKANSYNKMCAAYFREKLAEDGQHQFISNVHSRGGIQIMNTGKLLNEGERKHIYVNSYGSATLIPKRFFKGAENTLNPLDIVPMSNPAAFFLGLLNDRYYNVNVIRSQTQSLLQAHGFLEKTYAEEIRRKGDEFKFSMFD